LWQWINSYGGLSALRKSNARMKKSNAELRKSNAELSKQNARLAELESKLDIVLQSSNTNLTPPHPSPPTTTRRYPSLTTRISRYSLAVDYISSVPRRRATWQWRSKINSDHV
jgi:hypothetical protein